MGCSLVLIIIGVVALVKGELKITAKKKVTDTVARVLGGLLVVGSFLGGIFGSGITLITFFLVLILGVIALFFYEDTTNVKGKIDNVYRSDNPYSPQPPKPAYSTSSPNTGNNPATSQFSAFNLTPNTYTPEIYTPRSRADEVESDLFQTDIDSSLAQSSYSIPAAIPFETAAITGTLLSASTRVDTYPKHSDFNVYNIRSAFSRKPGQPAVCPHCAGSLKCESIKPSKGVRMDLNTSDLLANHRYSSLFTCAKCKWWCIRENWLSNKKSNYVCDFLIQGGIPINTSTSIIYNEVSYDRNPEPWNKALIFPDLYDEYTELPKYLVKIFPLK